MEKVKQYLPWVLVIWVCFVFVQSLFFKFAGHEETDIIFNTIGDWMASIGLSAIAPAFKAYGGYTVGTVELIASVLLLIPKTRTYGAAVGLAVISGAIFFHLFTPLGVNRVVDESGATDGGALFIMACTVWVCCLLLLTVLRQNPATT